VAIDYFTKWFEAMSTFRNDEETTPLFVFNQIGATFGIPKEIFTDHGSHFQNKMMSDLTSNWGLRKNIHHPTIHMQMVKWRLLISLSIFFFNG
jgi:hypothetical protein